MKLLKREFVIDETSAPTPSCHASTMCFLPDGGLMCAWFGGERESADDVEIWSSVRRGGVWSKPVMMSTKSDEPCWNPVLYADGDNVTLFYKHGGKITYWKTMVSRSSDGGKTWTEPSELVPGDDTDGRGPVKDKPLLLSDGTLIAGASHEYTDRKWLAFFDLSRDGGYTWERTDYLVTEPYVGLIQPTLWEDENGVHALMRSDGGRIYRADSRDMGRTWSIAYPTKLPNNNSGIDLTKDGEGNILLAMNPVGSNWGSRSPVSLLHSSDWGENWIRELDLQGGEGEFSYPAVIVRDRRTYISFTYKRRFVMLCEAE